MVTIVQYWSDEMPFRRGEVFDTFSQACAFVEVLGPVSDITIQTFEVVPIKAKMSHKQIKELLK